MSADRNRLEPITATRKRHHHEHHRIDKLDWLRAAVMGANDGILSIGALLVGVAGADIGRRESLIAAFAGLAAGATVRIISCSSDHLYILPPFGTHAEA